MRVQNGIDRFSLVKEALKHLPQLGERAAHLNQEMNDTLVRPKNCIGCGACEKVCPQNLKS